jgi:hypothetical protein
MPPVLAGILYPAVFLIALFFLQKKNTTYQLCLVVIGVWLLCYSVLTAIALNR